MKNSKNFNDVGPFNTDSVNTGQRKLAPLTAAVKRAKKVLMIFTGKNCILFNSIPEFKFLSWLSGHIQNTAWLES